MEPDTKHMPEVKGRDSQTFPWDHGRHNTARIIPSVVLRSLSSAALDVGLQPKSICELKG